MAKLFFAAPKIFGEAEKEFFQNWHFEIRFIDKVNKERISAEILYTIINNTNLKVYDTS